MFYYSLVTFTYGETHGKEEAITFNQIESSSYCFTVKSNYPETNQDADIKKYLGRTDLPLKQVKAVFETASHLAKCHLIKRGSGEFAIPEMAVKIVRKTKAASKAREGRNPLTGEAIKIAAKPKRDVIKVKPLKSLKDVITQG